MTVTNKELVHLARLALQGRREDVLLFIRRHAHRLRDSDPETAAALQKLTVGGDATRGVIEAVPTDMDSRLELLRREDPVILDFQPVWPSAVERELRQTIEERRQEARLHAHGLVPTRSVLLSGPPGVGKTLAARYLAAQLNRPLLTLDLSAVMSSFLGRTGNNVRVVLDYAQRSSAILLLDEFDAIAKRRDDVTEVGELKRLVTVLLQAVDYWPSSGLLVAATNHAELLDPAIWRRFDKVVALPLPDEADTQRAVRLYLGADTSNYAEPLSILLAGSSYSAIERAITSVRRRAVVEGLEFDQAVADFVRDQAQALRPKMRLELAAHLDRLGWSQRRISETTGISRDTLRKANVKPVGEDQ